MLRYLIQKTWRPTTRRPTRTSTSAAVITEAAVCIQVDDDNSEVVQIDDDQGRMPEAQERVDDDERRLNSTPKESHHERSEVVQRRYEKTKRCRKFSQSWKKLFPWITLTNGKMFCAICLEINLYVTNSLNL